MVRTKALESLYGVVERHAAKTFVTVGGTETRLTALELWQRGERIARRLRELGVNPGGRILVRLPNSEHLLALYLACAQAGYVACPVDPTLPEPRLAPLRALLQPAFELSAAELPSVLEEPKDTSAFETGADDEDFLIIFSSGSTGDPKGIVHSVRSMTESATAFAALAEMNADTVVYHHFPMFYMAGIFNLFFAPLVSGGSIVIGPEFSKLQVLRFWQLPLEHDVNSLTLTPTMAHALSHMYRRDDRVIALLSRMQSVVATGSALYQSIAEKWLATFKVPLRTCYGVTEVGGTITVQSWEDALAFNSMGSATKGTELVAGEEGSPKEILVRTPFAAKGYLRKGELVSAHDEQGFFHTGDLGYVKDGLLYYVGREHDLVKKGGEFVSTQLVEDLALKCKGVVEVAAVGVPDEFWGTRVVLFYVPERDAAEIDIIAGLDEIFHRDLRDVERPDKLIPVPWFPKTSIGKIVKRELLDKYSIGPRMR